MSLPQGLGSWSDLPFFQNGSLAAVEAKIAKDARVILPPEHQRYAALELTQPEITRVVIMGQDPYPTAGHAHGLAFSAEPDVQPLPRSLYNIYREMREDIGTAPDTADLRPWAKQGVLLLNTVLSVPEGEANGHKSYGWQELTHQVIAKASERPTAFVLWGRQAHALEKFIVPGDHLILKTAHPSPLSANRGFFGSRPFSTVNEWLTSRGEAAIVWAEPPRHTKTVA